MLLGAGETGEMGDGAVFPRAGWMKGIRNRFRLVDGGKVRATRA